MEKVREVTVAREVQASLRNEIDSYNAILDAEEMRLTTTGKTTLPPVSGGMMTGGGSGPFRTLGYPVKTGGCSSGGILRDSSASRLNC